MGPDLTGLRNQPAEALLLHIIVPNKEVYGQYAMYEVNTQDDENFAGLLAADTPEQLTLKLPLGLTKTIPRKTIKSVRASANSLMPDQLEKTMSQQELADLLELGEELTRPVRKLSLGQRMKAELLAALLHEPEVLFLDEPTLGLDVNAQARVRQFLAEYNRRTGATVLRTSHYMADITALCPRVLLIHQGRLFHDGPLELLADQLAPEREVRLELESPVSADDLAGLGRLEQLEGCDVRLLVPRDQLTAVVAQLLDRFPVRDLDVTDPPIEELIGGLFRQGRV